MIKRLLILVALLALVPWMMSRKAVIACAVAAIFYAANLRSYYLRPEYPTLADGFVYFGWPFYIYAEGGFAGTRGIIWTGLIGNVAVGLCVHRVAMRLVTTKRVEKIRSVFQGLLVDDLRRLVNEENARTDANHARFNPNH